MSSGVIRSFRNAHTLYARKVTPKANPLIESVDASRTSVNSLTSREAMLRDRFIAESFQRKFVNLNKQWKEPTQQSDRMFDVMTRAVRDEMVDHARPVFNTLLEDFSHPYMAKYYMMRNILMERSRNKMDESMIDQYLMNRPDLTKLRLEAPMPPEVLEPLAAFRGDTRWSFDARRRLSQKLEGTLAALDSIEETSRSLPDPSSKEKLIKQRITSVMASLPEWRRTETPNHPFKNNQGFASVTPNDFTGGIKVGMPVNPLKSELSGLRYPTLQRVAHTLPKDDRYRNNVVHSIRILERSRGWDFSSKIRAINTTKDIFDVLPSSYAIDAKLDAALPIAWQQHMGQPKRGNGFYRKGLRHVRSLTCHKGPAPRTKKK